MCVDKWYEELYVDKWCVIKLCGTRRADGGGGGGRDAEPKPRTPHKDVGKNTNLSKNEVVLEIFKTLFFTST